MWLRCCGVSSSSSGRTRNTGWIGSTTGRRGRRLQAYLQRVLNSGGRIEREYGLGRGRVDLVVVWPSNGMEEKTVVECKVVRTHPGRTIREGVRQTRAYMDRAGTEAGHLVVFDLREGRSREERIFRREEGSEAGAVTVWGM